MPITPDCPDCAIPMVSGFIPDATYGRVLQTHWHEGDPEDARSLGFKVGVKVDRSSMLPVWSWRCPSCGLLKTYASRD